MKYTRKEKNKMLDKLKSIYDYDKSASLVRDPCSGYAKDPCIGYAIGNVDSIRPDQSSGPKSKFTGQGYFSVREKLLGKS